MFCSRCGRENFDGSAFCSACGAELKGGMGNMNSAPALDYNAQMMQAQQYQMQKNMIRQGEMELLARVYEHFNIKRGTFQEYDRVGAQLSRYLRGAKSGLLVWGIIVTTLSSWLTLACIQSEAVVVPLIFLFIGAGMLTGGIMMKVNNRKQCRRYEAEYIRLSEELNEHYMAYPQCPVGAEYSNPEIIEVIMGVIDSGRADSIKEAINVMINEVNQAEMRAYLQNIESYARSTSASATTGAVFAAASFFLK